MSSDLSKSARSSAAGTPGADALERLVRARVRKRLFGGDEAPVRVGRFELREVLGSGAMGVVYRARDPKLDRDIALKLTRAASDPYRALREARALARIAHPNVIAVHDADIAGNEVCIAMELVQGRTLRQWLAQTDHRWPDVLELFVQAGRGLAAGHQAGVVHGDFKPENVLIDETGRVRVADFGVARLGSEPGARGPGHAIASTSLGGTPVYMAPEQLRGERPDARSDIFSFCVALHEGLCGQRPYEGTSVSEVLAAIEGGNVRTTELRHRAPAWLRATIHRGLRARKRDRFASMVALLEAVEKRRVRRRRLQLSVGVGAALALTFATLWEVAQPATSDPCDGGRDALARVWSDTRREALGGRMTSDGARNRLLARIDRYSSSWQDAYRDSCEATQVREIQSAELLDRRMHCLDKRLDELDALLDAFAEIPELELQQKALPAVFELKPIDDCAELETMASPQVEIPPGALGRVAAARDTLNDVRARMHTGRYADALPIAKRAAAEAEAADFAPLVAEAELVRGELYQRMGDPKQGEKSLRRAIRAAAEAADDGHIAQAWILLFHGSVTFESRREHMAELADYARAAIARAGDREDFLAPYEAALAGLYTLSGDLPRAEASAREAVALYERADGAEHPRLAGALSAWADILRMQAKHAKAASALERALGILESSLGPRHPRFAQTLNSLGAVRQRQGEYAAAASLFGRAVTIYEAAAGTDTVHVADFLNNLGSTLILSGRPDEALSPLSRALAIYENTEQTESADALNVLANLGKAERDLGHLDNAEEYLERVVALRRETLGPRHPATAHALNSLAGVIVEEGDLHRARKLYLQALAIWEGVHGDAHPSLAIALSNLGDLSLKSGDFRSAAAYCERARTIDEDSLGANHPDLAYDLTCLGQADLGLGHRARARTRLERALDLRRNAEVSGLELGKTRLALARATARSEPARAHELVRQAREDARRAGTRGAELVKEIEEFLGSEDF